MILPLLSALLIASQASGKVAKSPAPALRDEDFCNMLVVSIRHRRSDFPTLLRTWGEMKKAFGARGYDLLVLKREVLAVDQAIYARNPDVVRARCLDFFAARDFAPCRVAELPEGLKEAVVDAYKGFFPDSSSEKVLDLTVDAFPAATLTVKPPPGTGLTHRLMPITAPTAGLASLRNRAPMRSFPLLEAKEGKAELRLFVPGQEQEAALLTRWDTLRPLMREREGIFAKEAFDQVNAVLVESRQWFENQIGARQGEEVAYGALSEERRTAVSRGVGMSREDLEGSRLTVGPGKMFLHFGVPPNGSVITDFAALGRAL